MNDNQVLKTAVNILRARGLYSLATLVELEVRYWMECPCGTRWLEPVHFDGKCPDCNLIGRVC